jgi:hypothetical protein
MIKFFKNIFNDKLIQEIIDNFDPYHINELTRVELNKTKETKMPLWGKTDTLESVPKFLTDAEGVSRNVDIDNAYFVDTTEASIEANRENGIKTPGWILYKTYGNGRKYVETLVPMKVSAEDAGDANTDIVVANS